MSILPRHDGHDHSMDMDMDMPGMDSDTDMSMGMSMGGVPPDAILQQYFWIVIGSVIAFAALINLLEHVLLWQRLRSKTAKPNSIFWLSLATATAITREMYSAATRPFFIYGFRLRSPLVGRTAIVLSYLTTVVVFCYVGFDTTDSWHWEDIAVRIGCIGQAQFPLIFLLAGKQNIIGFFTGLSYERLNWLHRWVARVLWITMTMHMGFLVRSWMRWNYVIVKLKTDNMTQTGFAAWLILTAIVGLSFAPVRRWNYELFVISHLVLFAGLIGAVMIHVDADTIYFWICVGLFFFDRMVRFLVAAFCNLPFLRLKRGLWANQATFTPLPGNVTRVTLNNPLLSWQPGQHVFVSCHGVVPLQSHPFTIASLPTDKKLEFLIQARKGGTKRFHRYASKLQQRLPNDSLDVTGSGQKYVGIEGPYGRLRPLHQFDSVIFFAGSTGATFTTPLMRDLVRRWSTASSKDHLPVTRTIRFVWAIKSRDRLVWFQQQLEKALQDADIAREIHSQSLALDISVYVTCDEDWRSDEPKNVTCRPEDARGEAEVIVSGASSIHADEKKENIDAMEIISSTANEGSNITEDDGCGSDGRCCCRTTVDDETNASPQKVCCCTPRNKQIVNTIISEKPNLSSSSSSSSSSSTRASSPKSALKIFTGRPHISNITRKILEEAEGESAVVACGPEGLQDDVRRSVVSLSDDRAVHKGTGAQGVYLHVEGYSY